MLGSFDAVHDHFLTQTCGFHFGKNLVKRVQADVKIIEHQQLGCNLRVCQKVA
jgi:hypothetical protein